MTLLELKKHIRSPYAWPGGYANYFVTRNGLVYSRDGLKQEWRNVVWDFLHDASTGWRVEGVGLFDCDTDDKGLRCEVTGNQICDL